MSLPASIYRCTCQRTYIADAPQKCGWCGKEESTRIGPTSSPFDPRAHFSAYQEHPEEYVRIMDIVAEVIALRAIRGAETMDNLKKEFGDAWTCAKEAGDTDLMKRFEAEKDKRKGELTI